MLPVKFAAPPVAEVACGVMFEPLPKFCAAHVGLFWEKLRTQFPRIEEVAPIESRIEQPSSQLTQIHLAFAETPPMRRTWLLNEDGSNLIQIQEDRFLFNWKRTDLSGEYPSYETVIAHFRSYLEQFQNFLREADIGDMQFRQYELTYINLISHSTVAPTEVLIDHQRNQSEGRFLPEPEGYSWNTSYLLPEGGGRLHIAARSAVVINTNDKVMRLELVARGFQEPAKRNQWFDLAHQWITFGFADSTSKTLHETLWRRMS